MKIEYIQEYLAVAETKNYSVAAKSLYISQPTLSRHIKAMESELGYPLVSTSSHGVALTEFGKAAVRPFRKMLKDYQTVLEQGRQFANQVTGALTLGLLYYAIDEYFADFLTYFKEKYPKVELICRSYLPQKLFDDLNSGVVDIATLFYSEQEPPSEIYCQKIARISMIAVLGTDNPLCTKSEVTFEELSDYPLIELNDDAYCRQMTESILRANKVKFQKTLLADNIEMVPMTVRMTGGIHITGKSCQRQNASSVVYKPVQCESPYTLLGFCCMADNTDALVRLFLDEAQRYYSG